MTTPLDGWGVMERALELTRAGEPFALATVVWRKAPSSGQHGSRAIVTDEFDGMHVPNGVVTVPMSCQSEGALQIYIEPSSTAPHLVIVGRSPMAVTLSEMAALLDWRVDLLDGPDFNADRAGSRSVVVIPAAGAVATRTVDEVIDPVCGMTVAADPANYPVDHDGTTYYFCCPGCRYSFKKDPASFLSQEVSC